MPGKEPTIPADDEPRRRGLARLFPAQPPPGPFRRSFFSSPLRGPWLTSVLGTLLLVGVVIVAVTGFASHAAYNPSLAGNAIVDAGRDLPLTFDWPTSPSWLYAFTQGLHVTVGVATIPLLLAKLWSVIPRLCAWPPVSTPATVAERLDRSRWRPAHARIAGALGVGWMLDAFEVQIRTGRSPGTVRH